MVEGESVRLRLLLIFENRNDEKRCNAKNIKEKLKQMIPSINDVRIDKDHIEIDLFSENEDCINIIGTYFNKKPIEIIDINKKPNADYRYYLKKGRFWEAHESLEEIWKTEKNQKIKNSIRVAIQFCAAMVHFQRCNDDTANEILKRAILIDSDPTFLKHIIGIDLNSISRLNLNANDIYKMMTSSNF
ncbi:MAG: DUF309 domain-containing protein [Nitrososphaeria archaeon]